MGSGHDRGQTAPMPPSLAPIAPVLLGVVSAQIALGVMNALVPLLLLRAGIAAPVIGVVASAYFLGFLAGALLGDRVVRRVGHIRAFAVFATIAADGALLLPFFASPWIWALLRVLVGYAASGLFLVAESWLNDRADDATRGRTFAAYLVASWGGAAAGPLALNVVEGSALLFVVVGLAFATALLPMALTVQANPAMARRSFVWPHRLFAISPLGMVCCLTSGLVNSAFYALSPVFLERLEYGAGAVPAFLAVATVAGLAVQYPIGMLSDRFGRRLVTLAVVVLAFVLALVLMLVGVVGLHVPFAVLAAMGFVFAGLTAPLYGLGSGQTNDHLDRAEMVGVSGGLLFVWSLGSSIGPSVAGAAMGRFGPAGLFAYVAVVLGVVGLFTVLRMLVRADVPLDRQSPFVPGLSAPARLTELSGAETAPAVEDLDEAPFREAWQNWPGLR